MDITKQKSFIFFMASCTVKSAILCDTFGANLKYLLRTVTFIPPNHPCRKFWIGCMSCGVSATRGSCFMRKAEAVSSLNV